MNPMPNDKAVTEAQLEQLSHFSTKLLLEAIKRRGEMPSTLLADALRDAAEAYLHRRIGDYGTAITLTEALAAYDAAGKEKQP